MAGKETDQIVVGANGTVFVAPVGTAAPIDSDSALAAGWVDMGYINENGVVFRDSKTLAEIRVWQLFYVARRIVTGRDAQIVFALSQWNDDTVKLGFGGGTVTEPDPVGRPGEYKYVPPAPETIDERAAIVAWTDGTRDYRLHIPRGMVVEAVETNLVRTSNAELPITFGINGSDTGNPWELFTDDPAFNPAA